MMWKPSVKAICSRAASSSLAASNVVIAFYDRLTDSSIARMLATADAQVLAPMG